MATLEYTDAPSSELTEQPVPTAATGLLETAEGQASDLVAVALRVLPRPRHVFKGYPVIVLLLIVLGPPFALDIPLLIASFTAGFGFFLLPLYWIAVIINVWAIPDRVTPATSDEEGEQY